MAHIIEDGVEVVPDSSPQVYYSSQGKEVAYPSHDGDALFPEAVPIKSDNGNSQRRLLGLTPRIFWLVLVAISVIIAAAVGGGVGGSLAGKRDHR